MLYPFMFPVFYIQFYCVVNFACCSLNKKPLSGREAVEEEEEEEEDWRVERSHNEPRVFVTFSYNDTRVTQRNTRVRNFVIQMRGKQFVKPPASI
jgi:hypothetical protein